MLPAGGAKRAQVVSLLERAGIPVVEAPSPELDLAIVDLTSPGADAARRALTEASPRAAVLGITPPQATVDTVVLEVVAPNALDTELVPRVPQTVSVNAPITNNAASTEVARVSSVAPERAPKTAWLLPPPNALAMSPPFPCWSRMVMISRPQTMT